MFYSSIIFFKLLIWSNVYWVPPLSGWYIFKDYRNDFLKSYGVCNLVKFNWEYAVGYRKYLLAIGTGAKIIGGIGSNGSKLLTNNSSTIFPIINDLLFIIDTQKFIYFFEIMAFFFFHVIFDLISVFILRIIYNLVIIHSSHFFSKVNLV